jgi:hypothetical protein
MMKRLLGIALLLLTTFFSASATSAENLSGNYAAANGSVSMQISESAAGSITGILSESGLSLPISAKRRGAGFSGTIGAADNRLPFSATIQGRQILLEIGPPGETDRVVFSRLGKADSASAGQTGTTRQAQSPASTQGQRHVMINEQRFSDAEVAQLERVYKVRIGDANYWYDRVLGAWGIKGSPTLGFITPGLNLGGPLRADASGGGTRIFVNGRELHRYDVAALQQITGPILPGRYFITGQGLAGYEGGPPMWNLAAMVASSSGGGSGSHTWQGRVTASSGFSDGTTGAVFLPNGGIVSTGR